MLQPTRCSSAEGSCASEKVSNGASHNALDATVSHVIASGANPFEPVEGHSVPAAALVGSYCFQEDEQAESIIAESREAGFHMRRAIEENNSKDALKHAASLLWKLRAPSLSHTQYFRLYCFVTLEIMKLLHYFETPVFPYRNKLIGLYEVVQHAGNAIPRIYLCILVAKLLLGSGAVPSHKVLADVATMTRAIQDPLRGLYVRYFMINVLSDRLNKCICDNEEEKNENLAAVSGSCPASIEARDSVEDSSAAVRVPSSVQAQPAGGSIPPTTDSPCTTKSCPSPNASHDQAKEGFMIDAQYDNNNLADPASNETLKQDCSVTEAIEFYMTCIQEQNKLLTRLGYAHGGGEAGKEIRQAHGFILKAAMARLAGLKNLNQELFCKMVIPRLLSFILSLKDPQSKTLLFASMFELFPSVWLLLRLGQIVQTLFTSEVPEITHLFSLLSERFRPVSESDRLTLRPQLVAVDCDEIIIEGFVTQIRELVSESLNQLSLYSSQVCAAEVPYSIPIPPLVAHWTTLVKTMELVLPLALKNNCTQLLEPLKILLFNFRGQLRKLLSREVSDHNLDIIENARKPNNSEQLTATLGSSLTSIVEFMGITEDVAYLAQGLFEFTPDEERHHLSLALLGGLLITAEENLKDPQQFSTVLGIAMPYIRDQLGADYLARLTHRLKADDDIDLTFTLLTLIRAASENLATTLNAAPVLTSIISEVLELAVTLLSKELDTSQYTQFRSKDLMQFAHGCCTNLSECHPRLAFYACLQAAKCSDFLDGAHVVKTGVTGGFEAATYEFLSLALGHYEEEFVNTKEEFSGLMKLVNVLDKYIKCLTPINHEGFITRICNYASRLLRKHEQCRAILRCSFLFWNSPARDPRRTVECVQKALNVANSLIAAAAHQRQLLLEIATVVGYYHAEGLQTVSPEMQQELLIQCHNVATASKIPAVKETWSFVEKCGSGVFQT
eukprot:Gregarina_sp_Poly_1__1642@NODE_141_length_12988_cov_478_019271_g126_i0_p1_GENE_NODE_141_length_12988_cov_478_019271_g126_i0NODE_141_length_12988_cov_478_019271_g126_i0_p1_ORF_typecomplete_len957_score126_27Vps35/PF03635_17/1_6e100_NODE_141_length_12988_cov_478_019271_g126_i0891511785